MQNKKYKVTAEDKIYYSRDDRLAQSYQDFIKKYCNNDISLNAIPDDIKFKYSITGCNYKEYIQLNNETPLKNAE